MLLKRNEKLEAIEKATKNSFKVLEAVMNLRDEQENNSTKESQDKMSKIKELDKEIKEAEKRIEDAKKEMLMIKETLETNSKKVDEITQKEGTN